MHIYNQNTKTKKYTNVDYVLYRSKSTAKKPRWSLHSACDHLNDIAFFLKRKSEYYEKNNVPDKERYMFKVVKRISKRTEVPINQEIMLLRIEHGF